MDDPSVRMRARPFRRQWEAAMSRSDGCDRPPHAIIRQLKSVSEAATFWRLTVPERLFYRRLLPTEISIYRAHLLRLNDEDRRLRFHSRISPTAIDEYCARVDWPNSVIVGCFRGDELGGAAELRLAPRNASPPDDANPLAEIALSVDAPVRRRGIGTELTRRALLAARNRRVKTVLMLCLPENRCMQRIVQRLGGHLGFACDAVEGRLDLARPSLGSRLQAAMDRLSAWLVRQRPQAGRLLRLSLRPRG